MEQNRPCLLLAGRTEDDAPSAGRADRCRNTGGEGQLIQPRLIHVDVISVIVIMMFLRIEKRIRFPLQPISGLRVNPFGSGSKGGVIFQFLEISSTFRMPGGSYLFVWITPV
jgi:hypothetical protein